MNANKFTLGKIILDCDTTVHALLRDDQRGVFTPMYLDYECSRSLVELNENNYAREMKMTVDFLIQSWRSMGFSIESLFLDNPNGGADDVPVPVIVLAQNNGDQVMMKISSFAPINVALTIVQLTGINIYITDRIEKNLHILDISVYDKYIQETSLTDEIEEED